MNITDTAAPATGFDQLLGFTIPDRDSRGRFARLGPVLDTILAAHDYPPAIKHLLGEALVITALMGGLLKESGDQLTMQAQTQGGIVSLLVCDYRGGELRGYAQFDEARFADLGANPSLSALFGDKGHLAITFDVAASQKRYQGIVPLEGATLSDAVESYFAQSEQVPTLIRTAISSGQTGCIGGGMLVQHLPEGEEGRERLHARLDHPEWSHVSIMAQSIRHDELVDPALSLESLVWRLYHEEREIRVEAGASISRGCRCSAAHFEEVLARFPSEERQDMRDSDGRILVDCAFCSRVFPIDD